MCTSTVCINYDITTTRTLKGLGLAHDVLRGPLSNPAARTPRHDHASAPSDCHFGGGCGGGSLLTTRLTPAASMPRLPWLPEEIRRRARESESGAEQHGASQLLTCGRTWSEVCVEVGKEREGERSEGREAGSEPDMETHGSASDEEPAPRSGSRRAGGRLPS